MNSITAQEILSEKLLRSMFTATQSVLVFLLPHLFAISARPEGATGHLPCFTDRETGHECTIK